MTVRKRWIRPLLGLLGGLMGCALWTAPPTVVTAAAAEAPLRVISIDAGRKYFSLAQLKGIVDRAYQNGYTDVELALGNEGMRLMLDDMSVTADGRTYASAAVKAALEAGNRAYYDDPNGNALTQGEMTELLAYAKARGIGVIPVINSPGHADAILVAMRKLGIKDPAFDNSKTTVDLKNQPAIAFTRALVQKYIDYFAPHSRFFNMGTDEYANDVDLGGFAKLQDRGDYGTFIAYVNDLAAAIKKAGMRPMAFNDGIYYASKDDAGTFDTDIVIAYWTSGWWQLYWVAQADYLAAKGFQILNLNDAWYWVLGHDEDGYYNYNKALENMKSVGFDQLPGALWAPKVPTIGSMQGVWADQPAAKFDMAKLGRYMEAVAKAYPKQYVKPSAGQLQSAPALPAKKKVAVSFSQLTAFRLLVGGLALILVGGIGWVAFILVRRRRRRRQAVK